ncbi:MAG: metallophosphoesterase [Lachnospiraceae bacterium]|nr:metallophosphoesterase [Lachnospiraceae bacterium]
MDDIRRFFFIFMTVSNPLLIILTAAVLLILIICILIFVRDNSRFVVRHYTVSDKRIPKGMKIVFITDLHEKSYGTDNQKLLEAIDGICPDTVLIGGDTIIADRVRKTASKYSGSGIILPAEQWCGRSVSLIRNLSEKYPVYFTNGNHEARVCADTAARPWIESFYRILEEAGVRVLNRESTGISENIMLYGLDLPKSYYTKFRRHSLSAETVRELAGIPDKDSFNILLAHKPDFFRAYAEWGADLVLSGHLHGGMVRLPLIGGIVSPNPSLFPKYSKGEFRMDSCRMIVSCGTGMHTLPLRFLNPAELSVIDLRPDTGTGE